MNTGVGCHALLQGIFPTQGLNPGLPHCFPGGSEVKTSACNAGDLGSIPGSGRSHKDFAGGSDGKASAYHVGDPGSIPGLGRSSGEGNGPTPVLLLGKSYGQRSVVGYSP